MASLFSFWNSLRKQSNSSILTTMGFDHGVTDSHHILSLLPSWTPGVTSVIIQSYTCCIHNIAPVGVHMWWFIYSMWPHLFNWEQWWMHIWMDSPNSSEFLALLAPELWASLFLGTTVNIPGIHHMLLFGRLAWWVFSQLCRLSQLFWYVSFSLVGTVLCRVTQALKVTEELYDPVICLKLVRKLCLLCTHLSPLCCWLMLRSILGYLLQSLGFCWTALNGKIQVDIWGAWDKSIL